MVEERMNPLKGEWHWLPAGILTGLLVIAADLLGRHLGSSGGATYIIGQIGWVIAPGNLGESIWLLDSIKREGIIWQGWMVIGIVMGAFVGAKLSGQFKWKGMPNTWKKRFGPREATRLAAIFVGGILIMFGAQLGGGCMSGAILAGWPALSLGRWVTGVTLFITGIVVANLIYLGKRHLVEP